MGEFDSAWWKWKWGGIHAQGLKDCFTDGANSYPFMANPVVSRYDPDTHTIVLTMGAIAPPPPEWALRLGDVVANYSAALDHVAWSIYLRGTSVGSLSEDEVPHSRTSSCQNLVHSCAESLPLGAEQLQSCPPFSRDPVVTPGRPVGRLLPRGVDQTFSTESGQEWVDGALAGNQAIGLSQGSRKLQAVSVLLPQKGQDAVLNRSTAHLGEHLAGTAGYHVQHSSRFLA